MARSILTIFILTLLVGMPSGCSREPEVRGPRLGTKPSTAASPVYILAVHPLHNPAKLIRAYQPLIDYLNGRLHGAQLSLEASRDYANFESKYQARKPDFLCVMLTDNQGRILAGTDKSRQGLYLLDLPREARQSMFSRTAALVDVATPALIEGRHIGWARIGIGQKASGKKLAEVTRSGAVYALVAIIIGSAIAWFMGSRNTVMRLK